MGIRSATAVINLAALVNNFNQIKKQAKNSQVLAVLKANAYGHGLERIAKALPQADAFGVARIDEALALRAGGVVKPIVLLEGFFSEKDLEICAANNFQTIIHNEHQLLAIENAKLSSPLKVWLKVDTGMHRLGVEPEDFERFYTRLKQSENVQTDIILMSHLACADDTTEKTTVNQVALFESLCTKKNEERSMANSAGIWAWPKSHYQWVRPGLMLYGVSPMSNNQRQNKNIIPVMTLQASLIAIRKVKAGDSVGYGGAWQCQTDTNIGVIAIGYGDGYPRHANNGTPVLLNNRIVPLVGRVSMDMITVDLGKNITDELGDMATLWGEDLSVELIAEHATTIPYELLCNISRRVQITVK